MPENQPSAPAPRWTRLAAIACLVVACAIFITKGLLPTLKPEGNYDFRLIYSCARAFAHGQSPYERDSVSRAWLNSRGDPALDPAVVRGPGTYVYPPPALTLLAPFAALPWPTATILWALLNLSLTLFSLAAIARLAHLRATPTCFLFALGLAMSPFLLHMKQGQTAMVVLACASAAAHARTKGHPIRAGILLGLGMCLKPQLGLLYAAYEAGRLRFRTVIAAAVISLALTGIGAARLSAAGIDWWPAWKRNIADFTAIDDANPTRTNPVRYQVVNLHYPLHNFTDDRELVQWTVYAVVGALGAAYFVIDLKRRRAAGDQPGELSSLSFVSTVSLIVAYHRPYDAVVLAFPLALAIARLGRPPARPRHLVTLGLVLIHALPLPILFTEAATRGWVPPSIAQSWLWQNALTPIQAYALVLLAAHLCWTRWKDGAELARTPT